MAANIAEPLGVKGVPGTREPSRTHLPVGGVVPVGGPVTGEKLARLVAPMAEDRMKRWKGENLIVSQGEMRRPMLVTVPRGRTSVAGEPQTCHGFPSRRSTPAHRAARQTKRTQPPQLTRKYTLGALLEETAGEEEAGATPSHEVVHTWRSRKRLNLLTRAYRGGPHTCRDTGEGGSSSDERVHTRRAKKQGSGGPKTRREAVGVEAECSSAAQAHTAHVRHVKKTLGEPPDFETKRRKTSVDECDTPTDEERDVRPWRTEERDKKDVLRKAMKQPHGRRLDRGHSLGDGVLIEAV